LNKTGSERFLSSPKVLLDLVFSSTSGLNSKFLPTDQIINQNQVFGILNPQDFPGG
jgi:hypothetical protein